MTIGGQEQGLDFVHNVDFTGKIIGSYPFAGKFIKAADPLVLEDLKARGFAAESGTVRHTYPFCWRCNSPWSIMQTELVHPDYGGESELINGNKEINWYGACQEDVSGTG